MYHMKFLNHQAQLKRGKNEGPEGQGNDRASSRSILHVGPDSRALSEVMCHYVLERYIVVKGQGSP